MATFSWEKMKAERFRRVAHYWDQVRGDRLLPYREDIKFADFPELATDSSIFTRSEEGEIRIWYAGYEVLQQADMAAAGTNLLDIYPAALRHATETYLNKVFSFPCAWISHYAGTLPDGTEGYLEALNLPVRAPDDVAQYILVVIRSDLEEIGMHLPQFLEHVARLKFQSIDIGAGCPASVDVGPETDFT